MLILNAQDVRRALPMRATVEAMKAAYAALSDGSTEAPLRTRLAVPAHNGLSLFMPAYVGGDAESLAVKVVSLFPGNPERGLAYIQAAVLVLEPHTGRPVALLEGSTLTAMRTGAAGGAAVDLLARPESHALAVFGAGVQGRTQLEAACAVRDIKTVWIFDPHPDRASRMAAEVAGVGPIPAVVHAAASPSEAISEADIICTATTSKTPVFSDDDVKPGTHISAVGSYTPDMQELPAATLLRANLFVDQRGAALAEAGDILLPITEGVFGPDHIVAELGEVVLGKSRGRGGANEITIFKSVGIAVQDAAAAALAIENARMLGLGQEVPF